MSTFDNLIADLTRDVHRVQPKDALQFCSNWFQSRLEEQRARTRDNLTQRMTSVRELPNDHYMDTPLSASSSNATTSPLSPAYPEPQHHSPFRSSRSSPSPFGTLNIPGNALLQEHPSTRGTIAPTFQLNNTDMPESPHNPPHNPFASFGSISAGPGEFLQAPTSVIFARRTSVSAEPIHLDGVPDEPLPVFPKTHDQLRRIRAAISNTFIFRDLDEEQENGVFNAMREIKANKDEVVIRQGDVGDFFYVVEKGLLHCFIRQEPLPPTWTIGGGPMNGTISPDKFVQPGYHPEFGRKVAECKDGSTFGELALMYGHPRAATVMAIEPCTLWSVDRMTFRTIILKAAHRRRTMYEKFLASVPLLTSLGPEERSKIADALVSRVYADGEAVVKQGDMGDTFFFIEEGEAVVTKNQPSEDEASRELQVGALRKGDYFGELSLLRLEPRAATVSAIMRTDPKVPKLKVAALNANAFTRLLGPLREIMERNAGQAYGPTR